MRFSAAIVQSAPRAPVRARPVVTTAAERPHPQTEDAAPRETVQEPVPDLDQRVRLSGEW